LHNEYGDLITWSRLFTRYLEQTTPKAKKNFCKEYYLCERDFQNAEVIYHDLIEKCKQDEIIHTEKEEDVIKNFIPGYFTQVQIKFFILTTQQSFEI